jgi:hypothetical protein
VSSVLVRRVRVAVVKRRCFGPRPLLPRARRAELAAEREARDIAGLPWRHPENVNRPLRERYEVMLAGLAALPCRESERESELRDEGGIA